MTQAQIQYILHTMLGEEKEDTLTVLRNNSSILLVKTIRLYTDINKYRFYFDSELQVLKVYHVRKFSTDINTLPKHNNYSIITQADGSHTVFEIISDTNGVPIYDVYTYESIVLFNIAKNNPAHYVTIK